MWMVRQVGWCLPFFNCETQQLRVIKFLVQLRWNLQTKSLIPNFYLNFHELFFPCTLFIVMCDPCLYDQCSSTIIFLSPVNIYDLTLKHDYQHTGQIVHLSGMMQCFPGCEMCGSPVRVETQQRGIWGHKDVLSLCNCTLLGYQRFSENLHLCSAAGFEVSLSIGRLHIKLSPDLGKFCFIEHKYIAKNKALTNNRHVQ